MKKLEILIWNLKELLLINNYRRNNKIILFGSWFGNKFSDNTRFLYQYLSANKNKLGLEHVVWVTRSRSVFVELKENKYEVYMMDSPESYYYHRVAGVHIVCNGSNDDLHNPSADLLGRYSVGAIKINLWHGICGIKGFGFTSNEYKKMKYKYPIESWIKEMLHENRILRKMIACFGGWGDCYFLSTTSEVTQYFMRATLFPKTKFIETGYPRNYTENYILPSEKKIIRNIEKYKIKILYLPTFRDNYNFYIPPLSFPNIIKWLEANDALWIEKVHDADKNNMLKVGEKSSYVIRLESSFDINILINKVDLLITDYSSVMYEAIFSNIPVLYYVPDLECYRDTDRGLMQPPESFMVGPKAVNCTELVELLDKFIDDLDSVFSTNYKVVRDHVWGKCNGIEQVWKDICLKCNIK